MRVVWQATDASVASDSGEVASVRVDDAKDFLLVIEAQGNGSVVSDRARPLRRHKQGERTLSYASLTRGTMMIRP